MLTYCINGANMLTREAAHDELTSVLQLPAHYGRNLDALWDVVTTMHAELVLVNPAPMLNALQVYGCKLLQTLYEASQSGSGFVFRIEE